MGRGGERLVGEEEEEGDGYGYGDDDGGGDDDDDGAGPDVDSNPDLDAGAGERASRHGVRSEGQQRNRHRRYGGDEGPFGGQDKEAGANGAGKGGVKMKAGSVVHPGDGWVSLA